MNLLKYIPLTFGVALSLASCSDDDYAPGLQVDENCVGVYVSSSNANEYDLNPDMGNTSVTIEISRINTSGAVSVPVNVRSEYDVVAPATVDFADGETSTSYTIDFPGVQSGMSIDVKLSFPDEYVNPYKMTDGIASFSCTAIVFPVVVSESVRYNLISMDYTVETTIVGGQLVRAGFDEYAFKNFMDSGIDLYFALGNVGEGYYDYSSNSNAIDPITNFEAVDDGWYSWVLRNDAGDADLSWTPAGTDWHIDSALFYGYDSYSNYSYVNLKSNSGCLYGAFNSGGTYDYRYLTLEW